MRKTKPPPASPDALEAAQSWRMVLRHISAGGPHGAQDAPAAPQLLH